MLRNPLQTAMKPPYRDACACGYLAALAALVTTWQRVGDRLCQDMTKAPLLPRRSTRRGAGAQPYGQVVRRPVGSRRRYAASAEKPSRAAAFFAAPPALDLSGPGLLAGVHV